MWSSSSSSETFWNLDRRDKTNAKVVFCICISAYNLWGIKKSREREALLLFYLKSKCVLCGRDDDQETRREFDFFGSQFFFEGMKKMREKKKISFFFAPKKEVVHSKHSIGKLFSIANSRFLLRRREAAAALWGRTTAHCFCRVNEREKKKKKKKKKKGG